MARFASVFVSLVMTVGALDVARACTWADGSAPAGFRFASVDQRPPPLPRGMPQLTAEQVARQAHDQRQHVLSLVPAWSQRTAHVALVRAPVFESYAGSEHFSDFMAPSEVRGTYRMLTSMPLKGAPPLDFTLGNPITGPAAIPRSLDRVSWFPDCRVYFSFNSENALLVGFSADLTVRWIVSIRESDVESVRYSLSAH